MKTQSLLQAFKLSKSTIAKTFRSATGSSSSKSPYIFIHLGKTGGTTVVEAMKEFKSLGMDVPHVAKHSASLDGIAKKFPNSRFSVILRDPLERIISGFNSRLRQGRPTYGGQNWTNEEAISFSFFPTVETYLRACISKDERDISAASFATRSIRHIRLGYESCFRNPKQVKAQINRFYFIGHILNMDESIAGIFNPFGIDHEFYHEIEAKHVSKIRPNDVLSQFNGEEISSLKQYFKAEYAIYNELVRHVSVPLPYVLDREIND